jgi:hypothetical protein
VLQRYAINAAGVRAAWISGNQSRVGVRERDQGLELVAARLAFPEMPHAVPRQILGPFRQEDRLSALSTMIEGSGLGVFSGARGSELHDVSSSVLVNKLPCLPPSLSRTARIDAGRRVIKQQP